MDIIPAIDLRNNKCVRLYKGDYSKETVFSDDPVDVSRTWKEKGARRLHIVDLDGAKNGFPCHLRMSKQIAEDSGMKIQLGGGIRDSESFSAVIEAGIDRAMLGTSAIENPDFVEDMVSIHGANRVMVAVDSYANRVAVRGWTSESSQTVTEVISSMSKRGVINFLYTDIERDGTLTEPNFAQIEQILRKTNVQLTAAGGISRLSDLKTLDSLGVDAAIIGKALYTQDIDLAEAFEMVSRRKNND